MKLKCAIVDDEPLAIAVLEGLIKKIPSIEVAATFNDPLQVYEFLCENQVDFLFLDIEMPNLSGIDFLKSLSNPPLVIISSANKNYAIEGFELNVVDYILKPPSMERLMKAVNKLIEIKSAKFIHHATETVDYIYLKENKRTVRVPFEDILYLESVKDYVKVVTKDRTVVTKETISHFEEILNPLDFIRIQRSFIIAVKHIHSYSSSSVEIGSVEFPIGRLYKDETLKRLGDISNTK